MSKGGRKWIQHLIQHRKFQMLDVMFDAFERFRNLRKKKKEGKNHVGWCCWSKTSSNISGKIKGTVWMNFAFYFCCVNLSQIHPTFHHFLCLECKKRTKVECLWNFKTLFRMFYLTMKVVCLYGNKHFWTRVVAKQAWWQMIKFSVSTSMRKVPRNCPQLYQFLDYVSDISPFFSFLKGRVFPRVSFLSSKSITQR